MAKKVKKRLEEEQKLKEFEFPPFDVKKFILHELEQSYATAVALLFGVSLALVSWRLTVAGTANPALGIGFAALGALGLAVVGAFGLVFVIRKVRPASEEYRKGDWAGLIALYLFLWAGLWALFGSISV